MPTAKKPDAPEETTEAPPEETKAPEPEVADGPKVCAICGEAATLESSSTAYSKAYYCDDHGKAAVNEPMQKIGT